MAELDRIRWQCRRGLLELDLIFEKFNREHLVRLGESDRARFCELLELGDNELLDLIMCRAQCPDARYDEVLRLLRAGTGGGEAAAGFNV